ncbi:MAG: M20/M25/M40 family metallo-hydrolase [Promethearchaeota archaeon]
MTSWQQEAGRREIEMDERELVGLLRDLVGAYAPSGHEGPVAEILVSFFQRHGMEAILDRVGNVVVEVGSGSPHLFLCSHMDTIPGELPVVVTETSIRGRGAVDCRPSLAAMAVATVIFKETIERGQLEGEKIPEGKLTFAGIVREENSLSGMEAFLDDHPDAPDFAFFGEPTMVGRVCVAYKGRVWAHLTVETETGHVAAAWAYKNAIETFFEVFREVKLACEEHRGASPFYKVIPTLATIRGGDLSNTIPYRCEGDVDIRIPPNIPAGDLVGRIREILREFNEHDKVNASVEFGSVLPGYRTPLNAPGVKMLQDAIEGVTGNPGKLLKKTGTCFMNLIGDHYGTPTITYGPGNPRLEHTPDEEVEIAEYLEVIEVYREFLGSFFRNG